jgi:hypothetical protein
MKWYTDFPGIVGAEPLRRDLLACWPDRGLETRLHHLRFCPVVLSELYLMARHLPLTVVDDGVDPMVMVDLRSDVLRRPAFASDGRFLRNQLPAVTRLLPFCSGASGTVMRLIDTIDMPEPQRAVDLQDRIIQMLEAQAASVRGLSAAARLLLTSGFLTGVSAPLQEGVTEWRPLRSASGSDLASVAANLPAGPDTFLALRLLMVLEFADQHRQESRRSDNSSENLHHFLRRNEALRMQPFLVDDVLLDFSGLVPPAQPAPDEAALPDASA